jgi:hypothetical protein
MAMKRAIVGPLVAASFLLAACSNGDNTLMNLQQDGEGPDEFAILPTNPLETPKDLAYLPEPTLGGTNRVDKTPRRDAVAALGGRAALTDSGRIQAGEQALLSAAGRFGIDPDIRSKVAAEDAAFRANARVRLLERLFNVNAYFSTYADLSLNAPEELLRLRRMGIRTPTAPPPLPPRLGRAPAQEFENLDN